MTTRTRRPSKPWFKKTRRTRSGFGWWLLAAVLGYAQARSGGGRDRNPYSPAPRRRRPSGGRGKGSGGMGGGGNGSNPRTGPEKPAHKKLPGEQKSPTDTKHKYGPDRELIDGIWEGDGDKPQKPDDDYASTSDDPDFEYERDLGTDDELVDDDDQTEDDDVVDGEVVNEPKEVGSEYTWT